MSLASRAQQRVWFESECYPDLSLYNIHLCVRVEGDLDAGVVASAVRTLVARHRSLRTRFVLTREGVTCRPGDATDLEISTVDLAGGDGATHDRILAEHAASTFDLAKDLPARALVLRLAPDEHLVLITMHHAVVDNHSVRLLEDQLVALLNGVDDGTAEPGEPAEALGRRVEDELPDAERERQLDYWRHVLEDAPGTPVWPQNGDPAARPGEGRHRAVAVDARTVAGLRRRARRNDTTMSTVLFGVFAETLRRWCGQRDLVLGVPVSTRPAVGRDVVGYFLNTVAVRVDLTAGDGVDDLVARTARDLNRAREHSDVPFDEVVNGLGRSGAPRREPLFTTLFAMKRPRRTRSRGHLRVVPEPVTTPTSKFDLSLLAESRDDAMFLDVEYACARWRGDDVDEFCRCLDEVTADFTNRGNE